MRHLITLSLIILSSLVVDAQLNFKIPNLTVHDSIGIETDLYTLASSEDRVGTLYYYWAAWCSPCNAKIELLRPYAKDWLDNYNVDIKLIVYDRQMLSDSSTSVGYYKNNDWDEIGDLYFVHSEDADIAFHEEDFAVSPFSLSFLHRLQDRKLLTFSGATAEHYDLTIKDFFDPISTSSQDHAILKSQIFQDDETIRIRLSNHGSADFISIINTSGQLVSRERIQNQITEYQISKSNFLRNQLYFVKVGNANRAIPLFVD